MEDELIIELFFRRSEQAVSETRIKYGCMIKSISMHILKSMSDAEECENDTYLNTWESIPPIRPMVLPAFLAKIVRNLSLNRYESLHTQKRGQGEIPLLLDELAECIPDHTDVVEKIEEGELRDIINAFLGKLNEDSRNIFIRRYWFGDSIKEIETYSGFGRSKIKMSLLRSREELRKVLEEEGYVI